MGFHQRSSRGQLFSHLNKKNQTEPSFQETPEVLSDLNQIDLENDDKTFNSTELYSPENTKYKEAIDLYLQEVKSYPLLTKEEEYACAIAAQNGDIKARDKIISANLRLVVRIARRYVRTGILFLDLIEEGNLGLIHALDKFETSKGFRFSTYSAWWIQQYIERSIMNTARTVRLPVHIIKELNRCLRACSDLNMDPDQNPSIKKIADHLNKDPKYIEEIMKHKDVVVSFDVPVSNDSEKTMVDFISYDNYTNPLDSMVEQDQYKMFYESLHVLSPREFDVIVRRYGLYGFSEMSLHETGLELGLTRERVRQIQSHAISRLTNYYSEEDSKSSKKKLS